MALPEIEWGKGLEMEKCHGEAERILHVFLDQETMHGLGDPGEKTLKESKLTSAFNLLLSPMQIYRRMERLMIQHSSHCSLYLRRWGTWRSRTDAGYQFS